MEAGSKRFAPTVLIATTCRWISAARIAMAFQAAGCKVHAVCPPDHPMLCTGAVSKALRHNGLRPLHSFREAMEASLPDIVVPTDDLAANHLHRLWKVADAEETPITRQLAATIAHSLGRPTSYEVLQSRMEFLSMARQEGVPVPETAQVASSEELERWLDRHGYPAVLKADGTSGGEGVRMARSRVEALAAFDVLRRPLNSVVVAKRMGLDRDTNHLLPWLRRKGRRVTVQPFIRGRDANVALSCWQGKVLGSVAVEVLQSRRAKGPAAVVRRLNDPRMTDACEKIVSKLHLSGLCGFDFLLRDDTGEPCLIEINPRATQTGHLALGTGHNPVAALAAALRSEPEPEIASVIDREVIALFPLAWQIDPASSFLLHAYRDLPAEEPELVRAGLMEEQGLNYDKMIQMWTRLRRGRARTSFAERGL